MDASPHIGMHVSLCLSPAPIFPSSFPILFQGSRTERRGATFNHGRPLVVIPSDNGC